MRRIAVTVAVGMGVLLAAAAPATAQEPTPSPGASGGPEVAHGKPLCTVTDNRLVELSGLAVTDNGYVTINDSTDRANRKRIFFLDQSCEVVKEVRYSGNGPLDTEDLAIAKDGTIWVADTGDNPLNAQRSTVALWKLPPNSSTTTLYRLTFPSGEKHDAETLLMAADDTPVIVTRDPAGASKLYTPTGPLTTNKPTPMKRVGEFKPSRTGSPHTLGLIGQLTVTGGANSKDRSKVALRTYSDAYEWDVTDGDVVKAITTGEPRVTPLTDDEFGESIAYSADGTKFLTVSETVDQPEDVKPIIREYAPASAPLPSASPGAGGLPSTKNTLAWYEKLSLQQITQLVAGLGIFGLILVVLGVLGIRRSRRVVPAGAAGFDDDRPTTMLTPVGNGVYRTGGHNAYAPPGYDDPYAAAPYPEEQGGWYGGDGYDQGYDYGPQGYPPQQGYPPPPQQGYYGR